MENTSCIDWTYFCSESTLDLHWDCYTNIHKYDIQLKIVVGKLNSRTFSLDPLSVMSSSSSFPHNLVFCDLGYNALRTEEMAVLRNNACYLKWYIVTMIGALGPKIQEGG